MDSNSLARVHGTYYKSVRKKPGWDRVAGAMGVELDGKKRYFQQFCIDFKLVQIKKIHAVHQTQDSMDIIRILLGPS